MRFTKLNSKITLVLLIIHMHSAVITFVYRNSRGYVLSLTSWRLEDVA
jgi:hypothetical protein